MSFSLHRSACTAASQQFPLKLAARDAVFVVFREKTKQTALEVPEPIRATLAEVNVPWKVSFQPGRGAPSSATFAQLSDWSNNADPGIEYFSGTATYENLFEVSEATLANGVHIELDLGKVHEIADVAVNGKVQGIAWKPCHTGLTSPMQ